MRASFAVAALLLACKGGCANHQDLAGSPDLGQARHVYIAQHQTDVGIRNKAPAGVDHVRVSSGTGLDLRYDFPNEFEVHLANDHAMIAANTGYGDRHIRFGPINEINRPVIDLIRHRLDENRIA